MELIKNTIRVGNSAGVLLPKEFLNTQVKVVLQPLNIEKDVIFEHLGFVKKVVVNEDEVLMIGGRGNTEQRAKILQEQIDNEKDPSFKEQTKRRLELCNQDLL